MKREALLYDKLEKDKVQCKVCMKRCIIADGKRGFCNTRKNEGGKLYTLIYGDIASGWPDTIEKKPLYHFYPGSYAYSIGTLGCNFRCKHCQNWDISHADPESGTRRGTEYVPPEKLINLAKANRCQGVAFTYNEPTIWFEYTLDCSKLAKENNLYTAYVTNGYITPEALDIIGPYLDAFRVDVKGFGGKFYPEVACVKNWEPVLDSTIRAKNKWNMHVEVVTLVVPGYNDDPEELKNLARWIVENLGIDTPWHVTQFMPHLDLSHVPPTPIETLERAYDIGKKEGLHFVYIGNVLGHPKESTYCYNCGKLLIKRLGFSALSFEIEDGECKFCGAKIPITGEYFGGRE